MNRTTRLISTTILSIGAILAAPLLHAQAHDHAHAAPAGTASAASALSAGEVTKVDKDAGKLTIKHGPLANLNMPAMTMVFKVKDPAMLSSVKPGDKISFVAEKVNGALTVTKLEPAK